MSRHRILTRLHSHSLKFSSLSAAISRRTQNTPIPLNEGEVPPFCQHGAAIKYRRTKHTDENSGDSSQPETREYYACSVHRDRKACSLFVWTDEWAKKRGDISHAEQPAVLNLPHIDATRGRKMSKQLSKYLFSPESVRDIVETIESNSPSGEIACVGTPSLVHPLSKLGRSTTLVDMDPREKKAVRLSMYSETVPVEYAGRFSSIVCDPPFKPILLPRLRGFCDKLMCESNKKAAVFLVFPIFFKARVEDAWDGYKVSVHAAPVSYTDHPRLKRAEKSPVRLFIISRK